MTRKCGSPERIRTLILCAPCKSVSFGDITSERMNTEVAGSPILNYAIFRTTNGKTNLVRIIVRPSFEKRGFEKIEILLDIP